MTIKTRSVSPSATTDAVPPIQVTGSSALDRLIHGRTPLLACFANPRSHEGGEAQALLEEVGAEFGEALATALVDARRAALCRRYAVTTLPAFVLFSEGRERLRLDGTVGPAALRGHLEFVLAQRRT